jgi:hypothetical protein
VDRPIATRAGIMFAMLALGVSAAPPASTQARSACAPGSYGARVYRDSVRVYGYRPRAYRDSARGCFVAGWTDGRTGRPSFQCAGSD